MAERALILGGSGFIGAHLAARHAAAGDQVVTAVRPGRSGALSNPIAGLEAREVDLGNSEQIEDLFAAARPTLVYHLATGTPQTSAVLQDPFSGGWLGDLHNLVRLLDVARRYRPEIKALVRAGSLAEYGNASAPSREDEREAPITLHGAALAAASHYLGFAAQDLPFAAYTARLGLTYGPGQRPEFLTANLIRHCLDREPLHVCEPAARRDMIHVDDVARGLMKLARSYLPSGSIINLCSGVALSNRRIAETICEVTGVHPTLLTFGPEQVAPSVVWGSTAKARELLGFVARTPFAQGVERTIQTITARSD